MATITFKSVVKAYDENIVIPDMNLEIKDKEFIILVGPSGCGKSTMLRMIAGLEPITAGELFIGENMVNNVPPKDRDIAMVFQSYALYPHMSVYKNMAFGLKLRKMKKDEIDKKVKHAAKILDIENYLNRKPRALSGGQRQRVALGRAMVREPSVFLLDEPLSNLDAKLRTEMRSQITQLHKDLQTTFVYVTHDQTEAMTMADRIVVLKDGVVQQIDTPQRLYNHPQNMFVAGFIGSPQMNFVSATITKKDNDFFAVFDGFEVLLPSVMNERTDLNSILNKEVWLGFRPENLYAGSESLDKFKNSQIEVKVDLAELMGSETFLYGKIQNRNMIAKVSAFVEVKSESQVKLAIDTEKMYLFSKADESLICNSLPAPTSTQ